jgi:ribosomal protein S18 acetylase RimI-like enzyme
MSPDALQSVADLERRVLEVDGGRLKLEWAVLKARAGHEVEDLLWWEAERVAGFLGIYAFGAPTVELAGMVEPASRRRGIATALLAAALQLCRDRGYREALLVTPRASAAGKAFAVSRGAVLDHCEHALVLRAAPSDGPSEPLISLRRATAADATALSELLAAAFGAAPPDMSARLTSRSERTLVVERAGTVVGSVRLTRDLDSGGVYGFAVDPAWQGRGIGRDVLRRVCRALRAEGARQVCLEVAVDNDRALGLYTSLGFTEVTTEDYYALTIA